VIYLDSSVALAHLFGEGRSPPASLWREPLTSSRLLEYEVWNRINARKLARPLGDDARTLLGRVSLIAPSPSVLERALEPFPVSVRTLDAMHLASMEFLRTRGQQVELATYDERLAEGARSIGFSLLTL
jgi:predicted nucleic acid-binding protein